MSLLRACLVRATIVSTLAWSIAGAAAEALPVTQVAQGVFVHFGAHEDADPVNLGAIANIGFVIGARCVAVVDSGGSRAIGERLRAAVHKHTKLPVCYVINTHVHPDHIFGNAAFRGETTAFVGHHRLPAAMAARGRSYASALQRDLGASAEGSVLVPPTLSVEDALELDLGERKLTLRAWPTAHTDNDLTVYDKKTGTLWLSDLLFVERIPVVDGSLRGWLAAMKQLHGLQPERVIAGHGVAGVDWRAALAAQQRYLEALLDETRGALKAGRTLQQGVQEVGWSERERWLLFERYHRRNVTAAFAELEWED